MISYIKGTIKVKEEGFVIVVTSDIGYKIFTIERDVAGLNAGDMAEFFTYHYVREDDARLYGFAARQDQQMFEMLFSVTGIGPKSAMGILNMATVDSIKSAIAKSDISLLTKVSGVGKKTAERVILELSSKMKIFGEVTRETEGLSDALEALMSLGYSRAHAFGALEKVPDDIVDPAEKVRLALKNLGKKK
ncbi:Holliday junction branch migration protein RuvA [Patescibacteria group bacterium]|nr:Holliday junction branch migration protein RuvA [Patescibacteria group bacterium]MBU4580348.1 Holliday junction branch migration protein RuvA [Patescibacteria group bacterium]